MMKKLTTCMLLLLAVAAAAADRLPEALKSETTKDGYLQLLPGTHPCDGFFLAKLRRGV